MMTVSLNSKTQHEQLSKGIEKKGVNQKPMSPRPAPSKPQGKAN